MFGKKDHEVSFDKFDTLIGKDTTFRGVLHASGTVRVEGAFQGELSSQGDVVIGETGHVEANIKARNLLVAGYFKGDMDVSGKVELASTGKLFGNVQVAGLVIDEGGVFHGNCHMGKAETEEQKENKHRKDINKPKEIQPVA